MLEQGGSSLCIRARTVGHGTTTELIREESRVVRDFFGCFAFHFKKYCIYACRGGRGEGHLVDVA